MLGRASGLGYAEAYVSATLSVVELRCDGTKAAARKWGKYQKWLPTPEELRERFPGKGPEALGLVCGKVSKNLEVIDHDGAATLAPFWELVEAQAPGLMDRLVIVRTPRPGYHLLYRCEEEVEGNQHLAREQVGEKPDGTPLIHTLIETRGEGGYVVAVGSHPTVHEHRASPTPWCRESRWSCPSSRRRSGASCFRAPAR